MVEEGKKIIKNNKKINIGMIKKTRREKRMNSIIKMSGHLILKCQISLEEREVVVHSSANWKRDKSQQDDNQNDDTDNQNTKASLKKIKIS